MSKLRHIVVDPFWVDSRTTAGSQLADLIAHILMNSMRPATTRKPIYALWRKVMAMNTRAPICKLAGLERYENKKSNRRELRSLIREKAIRLFQ